MSIRDYSKNKRYQTENRDTNKNSVNNFSNNHSFANNNQCNIKGMNAEQIKQANPDTYSEIERLSQKYANKNENDLIQDINQMVKNGMQNGTLNLSDIQNFANTVWPMLNAEQRNKLSALMQTLKTNY